MIDLHRALSGHVQAQVRFDATVTSVPHFFYGRNTHAEHEAFDVRTARGDGLEVVDNVALAPPVPVRPGDHVTIAGVLIPDAARGPLVHWTHHDPAGLHPDGYIEFGGKRYA